MAYDLLEEHGGDLRDRPLAERRARLGALLASTADGRPPAPLARGAPRPAGPSSTRRGRTPATAGAEGLMLKRPGSPYRVGRRRGDWWKWKIEPLHGRRRPDLRPARQRQAGEPLHRLHLRRLGRRPARAVRQGVLGPDRRRDPPRSTPSSAGTRSRSSARCGRCKPELVFELAFEGIQRSTRHKSGIAVRLPAHAPLADGQAAGGGGHAGGGPGADRRGGVAYSR